jgi:hypothetical protein
MMTPNALPRFQLAVEQLRLASLIPVTLVTLALLLVAHGCKATSGPEGITLEFAPDMTITAVGLEDAKDQLFGLWEACLSGSWERPCTPTETADVKASYDKIVKAKERVARGKAAKGPGLPTSPGSVSARTPVQQGL